MEIYECRSDIRQVIEQIMQSMLARYSRTYVVRLDVRFPQGYVPMHANEECSEFMRLLKEYYTYHDIVTQYVVVREQNPPRKHHYHVVILFDGSKVENGWGVWEKADGIWQRRVGSDVKSCVHLCRRSDGSNGIMIMRPTANAVGIDLQNQLSAFNVAYDEAMTWLDYLAKTATKGHAPPKTKEWFSSHLWI